MAMGAIAIVPILGCPGVDEWGEELLDQHNPVPVGSLGCCSGPFLPDLGLHLAKGNSGFTSWLWDAHGPHERTSCAGCRWACSDKAQR